MNEYIINSDTENIRLDKVITILNQDLSRSMIQKMLDDGNFYSRYRRMAAIRGNTFSTENTVLKVEEMLGEL